MTDRWLDAAYDDYHRWKGWQGARDVEGEVARAVAELRMAGVSPPARLLEVGFGDGAFLKHAARLGYRCAGLERDAALVGELNGQGIDARAGGPNQLAGQTFDVIAAFDVFEHIALPDLVGMLRDLAALLGPDGRLVARFPNMASPFGLVNQHGDITHVTTLSPGSFAQLARIAGLETLRVANGATVLRGSKGLRWLAKPLALAMRTAIEALFSFAYYGKNDPAFAKRGGRHAQNQLIMPERKKVLVADFFGSVKERGIAAYVRDLEAIARPTADTVTLRAPAWVRRRPQAVQNLLMVLHEQLVVPLHALVRRPDLIIFPYNSSSFLLSLSRRTVCVIHDLIPYRARNRGSGMAFAYVACSARWHARFGRRLVAVSPFTARTLRALPRFATSPITVIPNCFTALDPRAASTPPALPPAGRRVVLVSGVGPNKAFADAIELMADVVDDPRLADLRFEVVGFGPEHARATVLLDAARARGLPLPPVTVHPLLSRADLDALIAGSAVTWAHSLAEGFGRVIVEGRAAGRPVVMSRLPVFRTLADPFTFSYRNTDLAGFRQALADALAASGDYRPYPLVERLRQEAAAGFAELLAR